MNSEMIKSLSRPPFATYDLVVYFGGGLFYLPILYHYYIEPFGLRLPKFEFASDIPWANDVIASLCLLFSVYIIGHAIAYFASQIIERSVELIFGKTSSTVIWSSLTNPKNRNGRIRDLIKSKIRESFKSHNWLASLCRTAFHLPLLPFYFILYFFGIFGAVGSRIPNTVIKKARGRLLERGYGDIYIAANRPWFKPIEQYVINNNASAISRMYNYLVISGLFRSMSLIFLSVTWAEIYFLVHGAAFSHQHVGIFMSDTHKTFATVNVFVITILAYFFSIFSYMKFQRRYVEETIFAFVFGE